MKKSAKIAFWVLLTLTIMLILWEFRNALIVFLLSLALASALRPFVRSVEDRWSSHTVATIVVHLLAVVFFALPILAIGPRVLEEVQGAADQALLTMRDPDGTNALLTRLLPGLEGALDGVDEQELSEIAGTVVGATSNTLAVTSYLGITWIVSLYWSLDQERLERLGISLLGAGTRPRIRYLWNRIWIKVGNVMWAEYLISLTTILALWGLYLVLRIPYPSTFALWAGITRLVPWLGVLFAILPLLLLIPSLSISTLIIAVVSGLVIFYAVQAVWKRAIHRFDPPSRPLTGLLILMLGKVLGLVGIILAPLAAAGAQVLIEGLYLSESGSARDEEEVRLGKIKSELAAVRERLSGIAAGSDNFWRKHLERAEAIVAKIDEST